MTFRSLARSAKAGLAISTLAAASLVAAPAVTAQTGISTETVRSASGFGGGTIYIPSSGTNLPVVAVAPGFTERQSAISWYGPLLAAEGYVVITIDTNSTSDSPDSRGSQLNAALTHVTTRSGVANRTDRTRLAVMGHSMGGGGSLRAAATNSNIKAAIPLAPYHTTKNWSSLRTPTMIVAAQRDSIASVSSHARRFYDSLGGPKVFLELSGASHQATNRRQAPIASHAPAFLDRYVKGDTSATSTICRTPSGTSRYEHSGLNCGATPTNPTPTNPTTPTPTWTTPTTAAPGGGWTGGNSWWSGWFSWWR